MEHTVIVKKWISLVVCILIPLAAGGLAAVFTEDSMAMFDTIRKPPLSPPGILFPVVWTILYTLMGIASWLILQAPGSSPKEKKTALESYAAQLLFNFFWSIIFFNLGWYLAAFVWLLVLLYLIISCYEDFKEISKTAAELLIPYIVWVCFAGYLNLGIVILN